jgi:ligand-binding sensor domain-containing protein/two-component sensor histidine kinase
MGILISIAADLSMIASRRFIGSLLLLAGLLTGYCSFSQEYNYIHYDVKDGLAGSTVYDMCQDNEGFIWFATEAGLSRFDGTHFKNFTTADGLPETEILELFADSKGRIWMAPFKNAICYYYKGKIYNQENDPILKKINLISIISNFHESADHSIGFSSDKGFTVIRANSVIEEYNLEISKRYSYVFRANTRGKGFELAVPGACYTLIDGKMTPIPCEWVKTQILHTNVLNFTLKLKGRLNVVDFSPNMQDVLFSNTFSGSWMVDTTTFDRYEELFLKGKQVSHAKIDNEKNIWFTTLGEGVYKLASREFKTWYFEKSQTSEIFSLTKLNGKIYAGTGFGKIYMIKGSTIDTLNFERQFRNSPNIYSANKISFLKKGSNGDLIVGTDGLLLKESSSKQLYTPYVYAIKSIDELSNGLLLVGTGRRTLLINPENLSVQDTIWPHRTTSVCFYNNQYYIGTVNGLYIISTDKKVRYMGDVYSSLKQRISYFAKSQDGNLWVGTFGAGAICMKNDKVVNQITTHEGLSSNICRTLFVKNNFLWVGTDKGINKINISQTPYPVITYSSSDGLPTDIINAIYVDSNKIYVGTPMGLTFFDETKVSDYSKCNLRILDIAVSNKSQPIQSNYRLKHRENSFKISYAGISFRSGGNIWYRYRLKGLTDNWDSTVQNVLEYPSLPPGNYELEIIAVNKKGIVSNSVKIPFTVEAAFWQTLPFQILVIAVAILITWILVAWRFSVIRKEEQEKAALQQRLNDLEQMALRAQMNPHFIFNCLNSIQNFIITNDLEASNWYLTEFAHLIRQTLDNSEKGNISVASEIKYLKRYLELEMMRFGHTFSYSIEADPDIDRELITIPTMILQPYIENSIRHGVRYKENGEGRIDIKFQKSDDDLICIIQDNGIGRKKAATFKSQMHVEYQSKGMSLTAERINILNRQRANPITIEIIDLTDAQEQPTGTRIVIRFPANVNLKAMKNDSDRNY